MIRILTLGLALTLAAPAIAQPAEASKPITVRQAKMLLIGLRNLDGHQVLAKQNGQDAVILEPWRFKSGKLREAVAADITILSAVEDAEDRARREIVKEVFRGKPPAPDSPEMADFGRQYAEVLDAPAAGTERLRRIKIEDLRLDENEIGVTTLSALEPILDR